MSTTSVTIAGAHERVVAICRFNGPATVMHDKGDYSVSACRLQRRTRVVNVNLPCCSVFVFAVDR